MRTKPRTVERYGYKNTHSTAGMPAKYEIVVNDIDVLHKWLNYYGNPNYYLIMKDGTFYRLVDDYGATNEIGHVQVMHHDSRAAARRCDWRL